MAPPLFWSETTSVLHSAQWRRVLTAEEADRQREAVRSLPLRRRAPAGLHGRAWALADELGWAKTYDAEYLALAAIERTILVTVDQRLRRGAERTGLVRLPDEL